MPLLHSFLGTPSDLMQASSLNSDLADINFLEDSPVEPAPSKSIEVEAERKIPEEVNAPAAAKKGEEVPVGYKVLHCSLQKGWYDEIEAGRKSIEFRAASEYWEKRVAGATHVVFAKGCSQVKLPPAKIHAVEKVSLERAKELGAPDDASATLFKGFETLLAIHFEPHKGKVEREQTLEEALEEAMDEEALESTRKRAAAEADETDQKGLVAKKAKK